MAKARIPEAEARLFSRVFICMHCGSRMKTDMMKVKAGKVKCRKCRRKALRPISKDTK